MTQPCDALTLPLRGTTVIEASAGTGKTYTITTLVLRLLLEHKLTIEQILVVTYTRAATAELRSRIRRRLTIALRRFQGAPASDVEVEALYGLAEAKGETSAWRERLDRALANVDEASVLTIHGFCQRVLADHAFDSGGSFDATLSTDDGALLDEIAQDYYARELIDAGELEGEALRSITPDKLRRLAVRAGQGLGIRLIPDPEPYSLSTDAWTAQRDACKALWLRDRDSIRAMVASLSRVQAKNLESWCRQMDALVDSEAPGFSFSKHPFTIGFGYFTRDGFETKRTSKTLPSHPFTDEAQAWLELDRAYLRAKQNSVVAFRRGFLAYAQAERLKRAERRNERTFDALLTDLDRALESEHGARLVSLLRERFHAGLVDEFQDTDPLQYRIFRTLFGSESHPLLLIGDPKQAIYGFRGADVFAYLKARQHAGKDVYTLDVNRRSDAELVHSLNHFYGQVREPFVMAAIDYRPVRVPESAHGRFRPADGRAPLDFLICDTPASGETLKRDIAQGVAAEIATLLSGTTTRLDDGPDKEPRHRRLQPEDIAVLCRTNNEAKLLQRTLSERGVPSALQGDSSVFESEDAEEIERVLLCLSHPSDSRALRSMLCSMYGGLDADALRRLESDDERWDEHRARVHDLSALLSERGFARAMRAWARAYDVERTLLRRPDGPRRITNLWHLLEVLSEVATNQRLQVLGVLRALRLMRDDAALRGEWVGEAHELRLETSENAVLLTTIHKSKGLEYPIVYVPFAWDGTLLRKEDKELLRFHDSDPNQTYTLDLGSEHQSAHVPAAEDEALAEGLRLVYVALTRAKHRVHVVVPSEQKTSFFSSALAYLLTGGGGRSDAAARFKALSAHELRMALAALCEAAPSALSVTTLRPRSDVTFSSQPKLTRKLEARSITRGFDKALRTASFSSLTAFARGHAPEQTADRDLFTDGDSTDDLLSTLVLDAFPRGAVAGQLMHEVLEHHDFAGERAQLRVLVERAIVARAYAPQLSEMLTQGLDQSLRTPLNEAGLRLADIRQAHRISEMEFMFPVASEITPRNLERLFRAHATGDASSALVSSLRGLTFEGLRGFLRGYIDLVFEHEGRFYIADYKSNRLGPRMDDYALSRMTDEMGRHQYFLQYHLYVLALHRHLRQRLSDYDYERHMGGVFYLFLRGMAPEHPLGRGVFFDRPPAALIAELDMLMGGASRGACP